MNRLILKDLKKWKTSPNRRPLLLYGARQVGKTWVLKNFGETEYKNYLYLDFSKSEILPKIFDDSIAPDAIIRKLETHYGKQIAPDETLLIFDEIQESQRAKDALKSFNEDAPQYHIAAAGSFLGVAAGKFPVGQTYHLTLYPMNFYEFLEAVSKERYIDLFKTLDKDKLSGVSDLLRETLKTYFYVGGMPKAVSVYANTGDLAEVRRAQEDILNGYKGDFSKHIKGTDIPKARMLWDSVPVHLSKEKKKFVYKEIKAGGRAAEFENAMDWLTRTGLVYRVARTGTPKIPLVAYQEREIFKLYSLDVGLLCAQANIDIQTIVSPNTDIFNDFNGAITEQYVLQELKSVTGNPILYWANEKGHSEVDFIMQYKNEIVPIEAKAEVNARAKSLAVYMNEYNPEHAVRTSMRNYGAAANLYSIPLFMIESIEDVLAAAR
ncbi:ATPase [Fibrobacteres bacterium R8-0-B4]